jgi:hypothetical protein
LWFLETNDPFKKLEFSFLNDSKESLDAKLIWIENYGHNGTAFLHPQGPSWVKIQYNIKNYTEISFSKWGTGDVSIKMKKYNDDTEIFILNTKVLDKQIQFGKEIITLSITDPISSPDAFEVTESILVSSYFASVYFQCSTTIIPKSSNSSGISTYQLPDKKQIHLKSNGTYNFLPSDPNETVSWFWKHGYKLFHICKHDKSLCQAIFTSWLSLVDRSGWMPEWELIDEGRVLANCRNWAEGGEWSW